MTEDAVQRYHDRMRRVLQFIDAHPDGDLSVEALSGVAAFSPHHFQRQFSATFGISVHRYVQLVRLERGALRLALRRSEPVLQVALDSGYEGPEAFARAFRRRFDQTPSAFRDAPRWTSWTAACAPLTRARSLLMTTTFTDAEVRVVDFPTTPVALLEHRGDPALVRDSVRRFIAWRRAAGLPPSKSATFNILYDDPGETPPEAFRLGLCAAVRGPVAPNAEGVVAAQIPGGPCAVLRQTGSSDDLRPAVRHLYGEWLPRSGRELRGEWLFAQRVTFFPDVPEAEAVTDVFLPLT